MLIFQKTYNLLG